MLVLLLGTFLKLYTLIKVRDMGLVGNMIKIASLPVLLSG